MMPKTTGNVFALQTQMGLRRIERAAVLYLRWRERRHTIFHTGKILRHHGRSHRLYRLSYRYGGCNRLGCRRARHMAACKQEKF